MRLRKPRPFPLRRGEVSSHSGHVTAHATTTNPQPKTPAAACLRLRQPRRLLHHGGYSPTLSLIRRPGHPLYRPGNLAGSSSPLSGRLSRRLRRHAKSSSWHHRCLCRRGEVPSPERPASSNEGGRGDRAPTITTTDPWPSCCLFQVSGNKTHQPPSRHPRRTYLATQLL